MSTAAPPSVPAPPGQDRPTAAAFRAVDRPGTQAATLPGWMFSDPALYAEEIRRLFHRTWTCIGREEEVAGAGGFLTVEVGGSGVLIVRDKEGVLRAFHNVCRHRGTRLVEESAGTGLPNIQCPYHAWTYDLTGQLRGAPHMAGVENFDKREYGLHPVALSTWRGFLWVNLDPNPGPLSEHLGALVERARPFPFERLRRAHRVVYEIQANWKLVLQNANECYHCPGVHPQLVKITPYTSGEEDIHKGPIFGGWMDMVPGAETLTANGKSDRTKFPSLSPEDLRRVYYYVLFPANFFALSTDYVTLDWFQPLGPERTRLMFDLYVDRDEPDPAVDAMEFWESTNRQDWHICELAHLGSKTVAYTQGRYSTEEDTVHAVDQYYLQRMGLLDGPPE
ncbi:MAG: aromatic ring-hydroxylating dioxygenase subunit alpha [Thermoplasmata archaeon]|nr:aromatic ring-hydroxylating dioxygenase subunit alpha [Thermoplasmata archaeon]